MNKSLLYLFFLILIFSCKKNRDEQYPTLQIISPGVNTQHNVLDPIPFEVIASDETHLERITVYLLNEDLSPVATPLTLNCSSNESTFESYLITTDIHLPSGQYYVKAEAFDGTNKKVSYREIYLNEVPRVLKNVLIVSQPSLSLIQIDSLSNGQIFNSYSASSDFSFSQVSSYYQMFIVAGAQSGNLLNLDANYFNTNWMITNPLTSTNKYFVSSYAQNDKLFIANEDGFIKSYRKSNQAIDIINVGNQLVKSMLVNNDFILGYAENKITAQKSILVHFLASGIFYQSLNINTTIKKIFKINDNEFLLIGNENSLGKILIYNLNDNSVSEPTIFNNGKIYDASTSINNLILLAHDNGLSTFNLLNYSIGNLSAGATYQLIQYDDINNQIYIAKNNIIDQYNLSPFTLINTSAITDSIVGLHLLYNK